MTLSGLGLTHISAEDHNTKTEVISGEDLLQLSSW